MREFTKVLRAEREKDIKAISSHNNSKIKNRTLEQNEKAFEDRKRFYLDKWQKLREQAETVAQIDMCNDMLNRISRMAKWF